MATEPNHLADARAAIAAITPDLVRLVRESPHDGPVLGHWGIGDLACHVSHAIKVDTAALAGRPLPATKLNTAAVAAMNEAMLAADPERDSAVLADRLESLLADFLVISEAPISEQVTWLGDIRLPASAVACHLLEELLVHGYDIASATSGAWTIAPSHAALAITGAAIPILTAPGPVGFFDPNRASGFRARVDVRLRGRERFTLVFDDAVAVTDTQGPADFHVSADPVSMLLFMLGRVSAPRAILGGKAAVWGKRAWRARRVLSLMAPP